MAKVPAKKWLSPVLITLIAVLGLSLSPLPAHAIPILDFFVVGGGTISYGGGTTPLVGTGVQALAVVGTGTPSNAGVPHACGGCVLDFTTGNFISSGPSSWTFGAGGTITLTGGISGPGLSIPIGTTLFAGSFTSNPVVIQGPLGLRALVAGFSDTKNQTLTDFFGLPNASFGGLVNLSFAAPGNPASGFTSTAVLSGDVANTPTPEPSTLLLIGSGLVGIGVGARRRSGRK